MPHVLAYHDVDDVQHWLASPKREEVFGPLGVTNIQTFVDPNGSNRVGLTMDVSDIRQFSQVRIGSVSLRPQHQRRWAPTLEER